MRENKINYFLLPCSLVDLLSVSFISFFIFWVIFCGKNEFSDTKIYYVLLTSTLFFMLLILSFLFFRISKNEPAYFYSGRDGVVYNNQGTEKKIAYNQIQNITFKLGFILQIEFHQTNYMILFGSKERLKQIKKDIEEGIAKDISVFKKKENMADKKLVFNGNEEYNMAVNILFFILPFIFPLFTFFMQEDKFIAFSNFIGPLIPLSTVSNPFSLNSTRKSKITLEKDRLLIKSDKKDTIINYSDIDLISASMRNKSCLKIIYGRKKYTIYTDMLRETGFIDALKERIKLCAVERGHWVDKYYARKPSAYYDPIKF